MKPLKLRIGEYYTQRVPDETIRIVRHSAKTDPNYLPTHPFVDADGYNYMPNGRVHATKEFPFDLVAVAPATRGKR